MMAARSEAVPTIPYHRSVCCHAKERVAPDIAYHFDNIARTCQGVALIALSSLYSSLLRSPSSSLLSSLLQIAGKEEVPMHAWQSQPHAQSGIKATDRESYHISRVDMLFKYSLTFRV